MKWSFDQPLTISLGPKPLSISKVKHGVTEATLSDGRLLRLTLHLEGVKPDGEDSLNISYAVTTEVMNEPDGLISDVHETVQ